MTESAPPADPRDVDDAQLATGPEPPAPPDSSTEPDDVVTDPDAEGGPIDPVDGADRDVPAGEDYAGSGF